MSATMPQCPFKQGPFKTHQGWNAQRRSCGSSEEAVMSTMQPRRPQPAEGRDEGGRGQIVLPPPQTHNIDWFNPVVINSNPAAAGMPQATLKLSHV